MTIAEELPQEILNEISDLRVFCLGYVTPTVRDKVCRYCQQKSREVRSQFSTGNEKIWYLTIAGTNVEVETKK